MKKKIVTTYMPKTNRLKATHETGGSKFTLIDPGCTDEKMHEIAAYNLMVKMHISVKWKLKLIIFSVSGQTYTWQLVKR